MSESNRPADWYADPTGRHQYRYWAGAEWTDRVADDEVTSTDPPTVTVAPEPAAPPVAPAPAAPPAPPAPPTPAAPPAIPAARPSTNPVFAGIAVVGGAALTIGSFLEAASASVGAGRFGVSVETRYLDGNGPITLILGVGIVALAVLLIVRRVPRSAGWVIVLLGAVGGLVAVADILDVRDSIDQIESLGGSASIGPALWVCLAGGVVAVAGGGLVALVSGRDSP